MKIYSSRSGSPVCALLPWIFILLQQVRLRCTQMQIRNLSTFTIGNYCQNINIAIGW